jgi:hypothetical protein
VLRGYFRGGRESATLLGGGRLSASSGEIADDRGPHFAARRSTDGQMGKVRFGLSRGILGFRVGWNALLGLNALLRGNGPFGILGLLGGGDLFRILFLVFGLQLAWRRIRICWLHGAGGGEGFGKLLVVLLEQFEDAQCFDILGGVSGSGEIASGELVGFAGGVQAAVVGVEGGVAGVIIGLEWLAGHRAR